MTGPEHYREAERLLDDKPVVADWLDDPAAAQDHWRNTLTEAQVHATLALAAATMDVAGATSNGVVSTGWSEAIA